MEYFKLHFHLKVESEYHPIHSFDRSLEVEVGVKYYTRFDGDDPPPLPVNTKIGEDKHVTYKWV